MNIITEMIVKADVKVHHLNRLELGDICVFIQKGDRRIKTAKALTKRHDLIVKQAAKVLFTNGESAPSLYGGVSHQLSFLD